MSVFGHGQMRLYLLALLREGPRHGYDVIRDLEHRFSGLYSPSAGTVYPRLAKLEEEGLVERTDEGRKALYRLTDAGRAEVEARRDEVEALETSLDASATRLAEEMRARVRASAAELRTELDAAAGAARSAGARGQEPGDDAAAHPGGPGGRGGDERAHGGDERTHGAGRPPWWQAAMEAGLGSTARAGAPAGLGWEALLGGLTKGQVTDADSVTRALRTWGLAGFGGATTGATGTAPAPEAAPASGESSPEAGTSSVTPPSAESPTPGTPDLPDTTDTPDTTEAPGITETSSSRSATPPVVPATGSTVRLDRSEAGDPVVEVVGDVVDDVEARPGSDDAQGDRPHDASFPTAEQVREVVAILKDAGERIREVLERPRA